MGANKQPVVGSGVLPYTAPEVDTTAPTVTAASIGTAGDTLTLTFSESVTGGTGFTMDGWTLGTASGSGTTRTFSISPTVLDTDAPALDYTPGDVQDANENALEAFTNATITNGSTQTGGGTTADFTFSPALPNEGDPVGFTYTGTGGTTFDWKKNGVTFSTVENPTGIDLGSADTYTITLTVDGGAATSSQDVTVFPVGAVDSDAAAFATRHGSLTDAQFALANAWFTRGRSAGWYPKLI